MRSSALREPFALIIGDSIGETGMSVAAATLRMRLETGCRDIP
jgi:hypothetical protein